MTLYQHQTDGAHWLAARSRGYLGDLPGLGKTRTLLRALQLKGDTNTLVVCPAIVRTHWQREAAAMGMQMAAIKSYEEIVRGGERLKRELLDIFDGVNSLILDEAHYCKTPTAQRTKVLLGKDGYARKLETVYCASGTPVSKNPSEIWPVLSSLFPEVAREFGLPNLQALLDRFCMVRQVYVRGKLVDKIMPVIVEADEYQEILDRIMLRRTLDDVGLDVPALDWQVTRLDSAALPASGRVPGMYDDLFDAKLAEAIESGEMTLEDIARDPHVSRMRRRLGDFKAVPAARMLIDQLEGNDGKVVVFAYHRSVLNVLREALTPYGVAYVDGDVTGSQRDAAIDRFQSDPICRVFLGQNLACQTGITLTAARRVVLVEPEFTADVNLQLGKRVARIGQTANTCIAQMVCLAGTLDEAIVVRNQQEVRMADAIGLGT